MSKEVLCMYDVRGIQEFIFKTNKMKNIQGASFIVQRVMEEGLLEAAKKVYGRAEEVVLNWQEATAFHFEEETRVSMEVVFIGGGNAIVAHRKEETANAFNSFFAQWLMKKTYALQLAMVKVEKTTDYQKDYQKLQEKMQTRKRTMPMTTPFTGIPLVKRVSEVGLPVRYSKASGSSSMYQQVTKTRAEEVENSVKFLDDLVEDKGRDSFLAVVHIDGNSMGLRIQDLMGGRKSLPYGQAIMRMREISMNISKAFASTYEEMEDALRRSGAVKPSGILPLRKIILAGDDLTFVTKASYGFFLTEFFLKALSKKSMFKEDLERYGLSACAGIAFMNSHYPFSEAYQVAEECCGFAKTRAKKHLVQKRVGSYLDFEMVTHISSGQLGKYREKHFHLGDGTYLQKRPYVVPTELYKEEQFSFEEFKEACKFIAREKEGWLPRSWAKDYRNTYGMGRVALERLNQRAESRAHGFKPLGKPLYTKVDGKEVATYYDALEMVDYFLELNLQEMEDE